MPAAPLSLLLWSLPLWALPLGTSPAQGRPPLEPLPHAELSAELAALAHAHDHVALHRIGTSREGRPLEVLTFGEEAPGRPAILLVANLEGPRGFASAVALHHARALAEDSRAAGLLERAVVHVLPRANPDAAEARFGTPRLARRAGGRGVDDDRDGRLGEDPPADVDGDGLVTRLRVEDPDGTWIEDPHDPRALVPARPERGERGRWRLWTEGRDADGDERVAEDPAGDTVLNRSFPAGWEEHAPDAGLFPGDEPEARALMDFVLARPELALVVAYDAIDDLVEPPRTVDDDAPAVKRVPPAGWLASDAAVLAELGRRYRDATGSEAEGVREDAGSFQRWAYEHRGLLVLAAALWELPEGEIGGGADEAGSDGDGDGDGEAGGETDEARDGADGRGDDDGEHGEHDDDAAGDEDDRPDREPSDDAKHLAWIDAHPDEAWRFVPWRAVEHPELGPVEVGGFAPFARVDPPTSERAAIADAHLGFLLSLGELLPRVELASLEVEPLGGEVWRVEAALENPALLPYASRAARRARTVRPARVELALPAAAELLAGAPVTLVDELPGSGGRVELEWLVRAPAGAEVGVVVDTDHAGTIERKQEAAR